MTLYERIRETGSDVGAEAKRILESVDARDDATTERVEWLKTELQRVLDILLEHRARDAALRALVEEWRKGASELRATKKDPCSYEDGSMDGHADGFIEAADELSVLLDGAREGTKEENDDDLSRRGTPGDPNSSRTA